MNSGSHILHTLSYIALPLLLATVLHEYAHGWVLDPQIMVIDTITHTQADRVAGSVSATATSFGTGISQ